MTWPVHDAFVDGALVQGDEAIRIGAIHRML